MLRWDGINLFAIQLMPKMKRAYFGIGKFDNVRSTLVHSTCVSEQERERAIEGGKLYAR